MRLDRLDLIRYGKFTGRVLDFGRAPSDRPDLHLVYGPNEAGKSTLLSAFLDLLFGIESRSSYDFLHPYPTMRIGSVVEMGGTVHTVARVKRNQNTLIGPDDRPLPDTLFAKALGGIDRNAYQMMFSLDDDTIEKGGDAILRSQGELGSLLFSASSGLPDGAALIGDLRARTDAFFKPQARKHELAELKTELDRLKEERAALDMHARDYAALCKRRDQAAERHGLAFAVRRDLRAAFDLARAKLDGLPLLSRLHALRSELADQPEMPDPPSAWRDILPSLMREETEISTRLEQIEADIDRKGVEADGIPQDDAAIHCADAVADIDGLDLEARYKTAARDMPSRRDERAKVMFDIGLRLAQLGFSGQEDAAALLLPIATTSRLQELAHRHAALSERMQAAKREFDVAQQVLQKEQHEGKRQEAPADPARLEDEMRLLRQSDCLLRRLQAQRQVALLQEEWSECLSVLAPFSGDGAALAILMPPSSIERAGWAGQFAALSERMRRLDDRVAEERAHVAAEAAQRAELLAMGGPISDEEANALRVLRERAWQDHAQRLDTMSAGLFETALRQDDAASALRLAKSDRVAQIRTLAVAIADRSARLDALSEQKRDCVDALGTLQFQVGVAAGTCGLGPETSLSRLEDWLDRRLHALETRSKLRAALHDLDIAREDEATALARLLRALAGFPGGEDLPHGLEEGLAFTEHRLSLAKTAHAAYHASVETIRQANEALSFRKAALAQAEEMTARWSGDWRAVLGGTWIARDDAIPSPSEVLPVLAVLQELQTLVQRKADLDHRIDAMEKDQAGFRTAISRLGALLEGVFDEQTDPLQGLVLARQRLRAAERNGALVSRLADEIQARKSERQAMMDMQRRHEAQKQAMLDHFGADTLIEVNAGLEAARMRARLRERITETEADLAARLGVAHAEEAEMMLSTVDEPGLQLETADFQARLEVSDRETEDLHAERREAERALAAILGGDAAANLDERRRTVLADIEARAIVYLKTRAGILACETALRLYRERHRSAMMERASSAFRTISGGEYAGLATQADKGQEYLIAKAAGGGSKLADDLSKGTRFQLYLALRMAGYHEIAATRETLPFIADDIMETFDDARAGQAFQLMAQMARVGQVIYLTHHEHLCAIARKACPDVKLHRL